MPFGRKFLPVKSLGPDVAVVPISFTVDAAGAVVDTYASGASATVVKIPATVGEYAIQLGRDANHPDRYKRLLAQEISISSARKYQAQLLSEAVSTVGGLVIGTAVPAPSLVVDLGVPAAASGNGVHAAYAGNNPVNAFPGPFTSPARPRNASVTFAGGWNGGNVLVTGTNQFGTVITETFLSNPGTTVLGAQIFATVTSAAKTLVGAAADAASIGWGDKLGFAAPVADGVGTLLCDDVIEVAAVFDAVNHGVTLITAANAARRYKAIANFAAASVAADPVVARISAVLYLEL